MTTLQFSAQLQPLFEWICKLIGTDLTYHVARKQSWEECIRIIRYTRPVSGIPIEQKQYFALKNYLTSREKPEGDMALVFDITIQQLLDLCEQQMNANYKQPVYDSKKEGKLNQLSLPVFDAKALDAEVLRKELAEQKAIVAVLKADNQAYAHNYQKVVELAKEQSEHFESLTMAERELAKKVKTSKTEESSLPGGMEE